MEHEPHTPDESGDETDVHVPEHAGCGTALACALVAAVAAYGAIAMFGELGIGLLRREVTLGELLTVAVFVITFVAVLRIPTKRSPW